MEGNESQIPSAKQHPVLLPEARKAIHSYRQRVKKQTGVKPSINGAINALLIIGERATRDAAHDSVSNGAQAEEQAR